MLNDAVNCPIESEFRESFGETKGNHGNFTGDDRYSNRQSNCALPDYQLESLEREPTHATLHVEFVDMFTTRLHTSIEMCLAPTADVLSLSNRELPTDFMFLPRYYFLS
jgi:hypothetical protein